MARLALALLGSPHIAVDDAPVRFDTRKAVALLAYLACTRHAHSREALAALLWPEYADARSVLRRTLSTIQHALGPGWLTVDQEQIALKTQGNLWLDAAAFECELGPHAGRESRCRSTPSCACATAWCAPRPRPTSMASAPICSPP
jgi:DNA-binding SARP family transcriptional activator